MHEHIGPNEAVAGLIATRVIQSIPESIAGRLSLEEINALMLVIQDQSLGMLTAAGRNKTNKALRAIVEITASNLAELARHPGWRPAQKPKDIAAAIRSGTMPKGYAPLDQ